MDDGSLGLEYVGAQMFRGWRLRSAVFAGFVLRRIEEWLIFFFGKWHGILFATSCDQIQSERQMFTIVHSRN